MNSTGCPDGGTNSCVCGKRAQFLENFNPCVLKTCDNSNATCMSHLTASLKKPFLQLVFADLSTVAVFILNKTCDVWG